MTEQESLLHILSEHIDMYMLADFKLMQIKQNDVTAGMIAQQSVLKDEMQKSVNQIMQVLIKYRSTMVKDILTQIINHE
jgi:hypothetical protein